MASAAGNLVYALRVRFENLKKKSKKFKNRKKPIFF
jgi:hypothetical protein